MDEDDRQVKLCKIGDRGVTEHDVAESSAVGRPRVADEVACHLPGHVSHQPGREGDEQGPQIAHRHADGAGHPAPGSGEPRHRAEPAHLSPRGGLVGKRWKGEQQQCPHAAYGRARESRGEDCTRGMSNDHRVCGHER
jgi:hypothetical protein